MVRVSKRCVRNRRDEICYLCASYDYLVCDSADTRDMLLSISVPSVLVPCVRIAKWHAPLICSSAFFRQYRTCTSKELLIS